MNNLCPMNTTTHDPVDAAAFRIVALASDLEFEGSMEFSGHVVDEEGFSCTSYELEAEFEALVRSKDHTRPYFEVCRQMFNGRHVEDRHIVIRDTPEFKLQVKVRRDGDEYMTWLYARSNRTKDWLTLRTDDFALGSNLTSALEGL